MRPSDELTDRQRRGLDPMPGSMLEAARNLSLAYERLGYEIYKVLPGWIRRWARWAPEAGE